MGLPILQGCLSTVLGLIPVTFVPSYIFYTFFKVTTLVMFFGAAHGLVLLPVLFSLFTCDKPDKDEASFESRSSPGTMKCEDNAGMDVELELRNE
jgi:multidrug efflux pump subunit AcrB